MKKWYLLLITVFLGVMASCSDEPKTGIDDETIAAYEDGTAFKYFKYDKTYRFKRSNPNAGWILDNNNDIVYGITHYTHNQLLFKDGKVMTPIRFHVYAPNTVQTLEEIWEEYKKQTNCRDLLYIAVPFQMNKTNGTMLVYDMPYKIETMTATNLQISQEDRDLLSKQTESYTLTSISQENLDRIVTFDSEKDALLYIIKKSKELFGNVIDLNEVHDSSIYNEAYVIDLNELEDLVCSGTY